MLYLPSSCFAGIRCALFGLCYLSVIPPIRSQGHRIRYNAKDYRWGLGLENADLDREWGPMNESLQWFGKWQKSPTCPDFCFAAMCSIKKLTRNWWKNPKSRLRSWNWYRLHSHAQLSRFLTLSPSQSLKVDIGTRIQCNKNVECRSVSSVGLNLQQNEWTGLVDGWPDSRA